MTTTINGKAKWDSCWRQACYLSKYIYKDPDVGFTTHYPEKMTEAEKNGVVAWISREMLTSSFPKFGYA